jgi:hypothetical protein
MNLRIGDGPELTRFLHEVVGADGHTVFWGERWSLMECRGLYFFRHASVVEVGGPYGSPDALVRGEGICRHREPADGVARLEVYEWDGGFYRMAGGAISRYVGLADAVEGDQPGLIVTSLQ